MVTGRPDYGIEGLRFAIGEGDRPVARVHDSPHNFHARATKHRPAQFPSRNRIEEPHKSSVQTLFDIAQRSRRLEPRDDIAAKKRAVDLELRRKMAELTENYALRYVLRPVVVARVRLPALVVPVTIQRKQAIREYRLYWNSLLKKFEPLACSRCHRATFSATFTNETVDLLCTACADAM